MRADQKKSFSEGCTGATSVPLPGGDITDRRTPSWWQARRRFLGEPRRCWQGSSRPVTCYTGELCIPDSIAPGTGRRCGRSPTRHRGCTPTAITLRYTVCQVGTLGRQFGDRSRPEKPPSRAPLRTAGFWEGLGVSLISPAPRLIKRTAQLPLPKAASSGGTNWGHVDAADP